MEKKSKSNNIFNIKIINNLANIKYKKDLIKDSFSLTKIDNTFITIDSKENLSYIVYSTKDISINCFDFNKEKIMKSVKNAHKSKVMSFRYNYNKNQNKEYVVSVSFDRNIKLWDFPDFNCLLSIEKAHRESFIFSLSILPFSNDNFILSSSGSDWENIRVWDTRGNKVREILDSKERTGIIDTYYCSENDISYIIIGNYGNVKSYSFQENKLYKNYQDNSEEKNDHINVVIYDNEKDNNKTILIDSCFDGYVRFWDFHSANLLNKIKCSGNDYNLRYLCLSYDKKYLFVVCDEEKKYIKIIDLYSWKIVTCIQVKSQSILNLKIIKHNLYGYCVLSKGILNENIKLWTSISI